MSETEVGRRTQFLHDYGAVLALWSEFELAIECKIGQLAKMEPLTTSIVLGGLSFGNKPAILYALLSEAGDTSTAPKVTAVVNAAKRNMLAHGVVATEKDISEISFVRRDIGPAYKVTETRYTPDTFHDHFLAFRAAYLEAMAALNLTMEDLEEYGRKARLFREGP